MRVTQGFKVAFIANTCFWLAIFFQYWKNARQIPSILLQTILILGVIAIVININVYAFFLIKKWQASRVNDKHGGEMPTKTGVRFLHFFNGVTFLAQTFFLISRL